MHLITVLVTALKARYARLEPEGGFEMAQALVLTAILIAAGVVIVAAVQAAGLDIVARIQTLVNNDLAAP